jgi:hypothetical protein
MAAHADETRCALTSRSSDKDKPTVTAALPTADPWQQHHDGSTSTDGKNVNVSGLRTERR